MYLASCAAYFERRVPKNAIFISFWRRDVLVAALVKANIEHRKIEIPDENHYAKS